MRRMVDPLGLWVTRSKWSRLTPNRTFWQPTIERSARPARPKFLDDLPSSVQGFEMDIMIRSLDLRTVMLVSRSLYKGIFDLGFQKFLQKMIP